MGTFFCLLCKKDRDWVGIFGKYAYRTSRGGFMNLYNLCAIRYDQKTKQSLLYFLDYGELPCFQKPLQILNRWCMHHGSDMKGRMESCKYVLQIQKKVPVLVCLYMQCIFFPTHGYTCLDCIWLQAKMIQTVKAIDTSSCEVYFLDGYCMKIPVGCRVIQKQLERCKTYYEKITVPVQVSVLQEMR